MKTNKVTITRKEIIRALRKENLRSGSWFDIISTVAEEGCDFTDTKKFKTCNVCAVGAVLRAKHKEFAPLLNILDEGFDGSSFYDFNDAITNHVIKNMATVYDYDYDHDYDHEDSYSSDGDISTDEIIANTIADENYLGALSMFFENMMSEAASKANIDNEDVRITKFRREKLINFVKQNFPVKFVITYKV